LPTRTDGEHLPANGAARSVVTDQRKVNRKRQARLSRSVRSTRTASRDELVCKASDRVQVQRGRESEQHLLHARLLVSRDTLANRRGTSNQRRVAEAGPHSLGNLCQSLLISIFNNTIRACRAMDALVVT